MNIFITVLLFSEWTFSTNKYWKWNVLSFVTRCIQVSIKLQYTLSLFDPLWSNISVLYSLIDKNSSKKGFKHKLKIITVSLKSEKKICLKKEEGKRLEQ